MRSYLSLLLVLVSLISYSSSLSKNNHPTSTHSCSRLYAGFGGGGRRPMEPAGSGSSLPPAMHDRCPCNNDGKPAYKDCCQPFHSGSERNTPESLLRSRFSAYASGNTDYIIATSSDKNPDYDYHLKSTPTGRERALRNWAKEIRKNMVEGYKYIRLEVAEVAYSSEESCEATSRFLAVSNRVGGGEYFPIEEVTQMVRGADGGWLHLGSQPQRPPPEIGAMMMEKWPALAGVDIKFVDAEGKDMVQRALNKKVEE